MDIAPRRGHAAGDATRRDRWEKEKTVGGLLFIFCLAKTKKAGRTAMTALAGMDTNPRSKSCVKSDQPFGVLARYSPTAVAPL